MILGVDHLSLSCEEIDSAVGLLVQAGYRVQFIERRLPNHPSKRSFLKRYQPLHAVAYCEAKIGVSIELTEHGALGSDGIKEGGYQPWLSAPPPDVVPLRGLRNYWTSALESALGSLRPHAGFWMPFQAEVWYDERGSLPQMAIPAVMVPINDLKRSGAFWRNGLGATLLGEGTDPDGNAWLRFSFLAPLPKWSLDVILVEVQEVGGPTFLDSKGFPCLALLTTDLAGDYERLKEQGAMEFSGEFPLGINGRALKVALARGPGGEIIELVQVEHRHESKN